MRLEDMKKDIPETPEFIHTMIQSEVKKQLQDTKVVNIQTRRVKKWTGARVAAAIAVCVLVTSTIVYAGTKLYHMFLEKQGAYSIVTGIKADGSTGKINLPERIHDIDISAGYIPEGMEWIDELHLEIRMLLTVRNELLAIMKVYILNIMTWQRMDLLIKGFTFFAQMYIV